MIIYLPRHRQPAVIIDNIPNKNKNGTASRSLSAVRLVHTTTVAESVDMAIEAVHHTATSSPRSGLFRNHHTRSNNNNDDEEEAESWGEMKRLSELAFGIPATNNRSRSKRTAPLRWRMPPPTSAMTSSSSAATSSPDPIIVYSPEPGQARAGCGVVVLVEHEEPDNNNNHNHFHEQEELLKDEKVSSSDGTRQEHARLQGEQEQHHPGLAATSPDERMHAPPAKEEKARSSSSHKMEQFPPNAKRKDLARKPKPVSSDGDGDIMHTVPAVRPSEQGDRMEFRESQTPKEGPSPSNTKAQNANNIHQKGGSAASSANDGKMTISASGDTPTNDKRASPRGSKSRNTSNKQKGHAASARGEMTTPLTPDKEEQQQQHEHSKENCADTEEERDSAVTTRNNLCDEEQRDDANKEDVVVEVRKAPSVLPHNNKRGSDKKVFSPRGRRFDTLNERRDDQDGGGGGGGSYSRRVESLVDAMIGFWGESLVPEDSSLAPRENSQNTVVSIPYDPTGDVSELWAEVSIMKPNIGAMSEFWSEASTMEEAKVVMNAVETYFMSSSE